MKKRIFIFILICMTGIMTAACANNDRAEDNTSAILQDDTEAQTTKANETETPTPEETEIRFELNTVESLEDDGKEMSVAEAIKSAMKGKHLALELMYDERLFHLSENERIEDGWNEVTEIKDIEKKTEEHISRNAAHFLNKGQTGF